MSRGISPVVGTLLLVAITVIAAATVGVAVSGTSLTSTPTVALDVSADADSQRISLTHESGDTVDLNRVDVRIRIDGEGLTHQPPVPFFAARGFESGPNGPFNSASPDQWQAGETATLELAATNDPLIDPGDRVTVLVRTGQRVIAEMTTTA